MYNLGVVGVGRAIEPRFLATQQITLKSLLEYCMAIERTLSIIKPDAVAKNVIGKIYDRFESAGLKIVASKMAHLSQSEAGRARE